MAPDQETGSPTAWGVLWALGAASLLVLLYEMRVIITSILWPMLTNPHVAETDFQFYYDAATRFAADPHRLYGDLTNPIIGYAYPPPAILPFALLSRLSLGEALFVFTAASYAVLFIALMLWLRHARAHGLAIDPWTSGAVTMMALASGPTYSNAVFGQVNAFVLFSAVGFLVWCETMPAAAGLTLALGFWLKLYPALLLVVALWHRRAWRGIAWALAMIARLPVVVSTMVPLYLYRVWVLDVLAARLSVTTLNILNQSLSAFLLRFRSPITSYFAWSTVPVPAGIRAANLALAAFAVLGWRWAGEEPSGSASVGRDAVPIALMAVVAPLGWGHAYVLALPLVMVVAARLSRAGPVYAGVTAVCVAALMVPAYHQFGIARGWPAGLQDLLYSRYLLATAILAVLAMSRDKQPLLTIRPITDYGLLP